MPVFRRATARSAHVASITVALSAAVCGLATAPARAAGTPFQRGDVFVVEGDGIHQFSPAGDERTVVPGTAGATSLCFDPSGQHLILPGVGLFDSSGNALASSWASVTDAQRCVADALGHVYVSSGTGGYAITRYDVSGKARQRFPIGDPEVHTLALDIAPDECTLHYGSWGVPQGGAIGRLDACASIARSPFNTDPDVDDLRLLPDWQVLVADDTSSRLYDASGQFVRTYRPGTGFSGDSLRTLALDPDGTSFWTCCSSTSPSTVNRAFRFDIAGGRLLSDWALPGVGNGVFSPMAVYAPPLAGDADGEKSVDADSAGTAEAFTAKAGATGALTRLHLYVDASSAASSAVVGIYSDRNNHPDALLAQATITGLRAGAWSYAGVPPVTVTAGQRYWIAVLGPRGAGSLRVRDAGGGGRSETSSQRTLTTLPARWTTGAAWASAPLSAYGS